jgi:rRNA maturation endonuclease Nob1
MRKPSVKNCRREMAEEVLNNIQQTEKKNELSDSDAALYVHVYIHLN